MNIKEKNNETTLVKLISSIRKPLIGFFNVLYRILFEYSKYVLLAVVFIVCADVVSRNVFRHSILWVQETSLLLIVWMTFLSMAIGAEKNLHIGIDLFYDKFPKPLQIFLTYLNKIIIIVIGIFLGIYGWKLSMSAWKSTLAVTKLPAGMLYLMIPVGGWAMAFFMLLDILGLKKYKKTNYNEEEVPLKDVEEVLAKLATYQHTEPTTTTTTTTTTE